jgi:hypothetical protein
MRALVSLLLNLSLTLVLSAAALGQAQKPAAAKTPNSELPTPNSKDFFPISEVRPGMRAVGYTVFTGSDPKPFEVEILGVLEGFPNPNQSAVISRLAGPDIQRTSVFAGMSGSPVYIDGRLLGAVAFGYQFMTEPIAGITPIQHMIEVFEQQQKQEKTGEKSSDAPRSVSFSEIAFNENSREFAAFVNAPAGGANFVSSAAAGQVLMPIATPLAISGVAPDVIARFAPQFQSLGFTPVAGVAGAARVSELAKSDENTLKPGSTVVVPLVRGDFSLAAAGTVTHRDGNKVYAFGHPFLSVGVSDYPMNEGEVVTVVPNAANSFKLAVPKAMVGAMRGDRSTGIYGELGVAPKMIPVEITLNTSRGGSKTYRYEMVADRFLTPLLMQLTTLATISSTERTIGDSTLSLQTRIQLKEQPEIRLENRLSVSANAPLAATFAVNQPISLLFTSGFKDMQIERIALNITSRDARNTGKLDRLWVSKTEVRRGEKVELQAFARTEGGGEYVERIQLEIPADAPLGQTQVVVGDGPAIQATEGRTGFTPKSLGQLVRELNRVRKADRLYVKLARAEPGAVVNNEEMPSLPPSVLATLGSDRTAGGYTLTRSATLFEKELPPADFVISGQRTLTITVAEK